MEPTTIAVVLAAALLAGLAQGLTGFGFALIVVPMMILVVDVPDAVVISTLLGTVSVALVAARGYEEIVWPTVWRLLAGSIAGMPFGLLILLFAPEEPLRLAVGLSVLVMAAWLVRGATIPTAGLKTELAVGTVSGVLRTSTSLAGPPVVSYLQARSFAPGPFRATIVAFFLTGNLVALAAFGVTGVITADTLAYAAIGIPLTVIGVVAGDRLLAMTDPALFRRFVLALLIGTALAAVAFSIERLVA